jgi:DNA-binding NtrC family response regulator
MSEPRLVHGYLHNATPKPQPREKKPDAPDERHVVHFAFVVGAMPLRDILEDVERSMLSAALIAGGGNKTEAAKLLRIARESVYDKMIRLGIEVGK